MPAIQQKVRGEVGVKTWMQAVLYVANEVIRVWLIILQQRGLGNEKLLQDKETLINGLFTWLTTRHMESATLEIYKDEESKAVERWDMIFKYADPNKEDVRGKDEVDGIWKTYLDEISKFMRNLSALPYGTNYRVVVSLLDQVEGSSPPEVPGWFPTTLRDVNELKHHKFGEDIVKGGGKIQARMEFWGRL